MRKGHPKTGSRKLQVLRFALCLFVIALSVPAGAQQPNKLSRIGFLDGASLPAEVARTEAFRQGLRELGYIEGKNILIEWRSA